MSKKTSTTSVIADEDQFLDTIHQENTKETVINGNQKLFFFFVAQISTLLPSYLFQGVRDLEFSGMTVALFLIVSTVAAFLLYLAYQNIFLRSKPTLTRRYEEVLNAGTTGGKKSSAVKDQLIELGTTGYALFFSNTLYLGLTLFFGFYVLERADVRVSYTFSLIASAAALYLLSTTKPRNKAAGKY